MKNDFFLFITSIQISEIYRPLAASVTRPMATEVHSTSGNDVSVKEHTSSLEIVDFSSPIASFTISINLVSCSVNFSHTSQVSDW